MLICTNVTWFQPLVAAFTHKNTRWNQYQRASRLINNIVCTRVLSPPQKWPQTQKNLARMSATLFTNNTAASECASTRGAILQPTERKFTMLWVSVWSNRCSPVWDIYFHCQVRWFPIIKLSKRVYVKRFQVLWARTRVVLHIFQERSASWLMLHAKHLRTPNFGFQCCWKQFLMQSQSSVPGLLWCAWIVQHVIQNCAGWLHPNLHEISCHVNANFCCLLAPDHPSSRLHTVTPSHPKQISSFVFHWAALFLQCFFIGPKFFVFGALALLCFCVMFIHDT